MKFVVNLVDKLKAYDGSSFQIIVVEKSIRDYFGLQLTLVTNLSPIILHLIDDGFGDDIKHGLFFNLNKDMLLKYIPHLVLIYNRLDDNFINKSDYIKNKDASRYKYKFMSGSSMAVFKRKGGDIWRSSS